MMIVNLALLCASVVSLAWVPTGTALLLDVFLYASVCWYQLQFSKVSLLNATLLVAYLGIAILYHGFGVSDVLPVTGVIVYLAFTVVFLASATRGAWPARATNLIFAALSIAAIGLSVGLRPSRSYIYAPIALLAITLRKREEIEKSFTNLKTTAPWVYVHKGFEARVAQNLEDVASLNAVVTEAYREVYLDSGARLIDDLDGAGFSQLVQFSAESPSKVGLVFRAPDGQAAGAAVLYLDECDKPLPIENELGLGLDDQRAKFGRLAEIGRLSIVPRYRGDGALLDAIFRAVAHQCMEHDISLLVCQALERPYPLYRKIGFKPMFSDGRRTLDLEFKMKVIACSLNIAKTLETRLAGRPESPSFAKFTEYKKRIPAPALQEVGT